MLSYIVRILILFAGFVLLLRALRSLVRPGRRNPVEPKAPPPKPTHMVRDPTCGMYLDPRLAVRLEQNRETYYFCSDECRRKYAPTRP